MSNRAFFRVNSDGETLIIPERIYSDLSELRSRRPLAEDEGIILHCLLSRHINGFEREAALREIIASPFPWVAPFVLRLVGEYVIEILNVIESGLGFLDRDMYGRFLSENEAFYGLIKSRVVSYWDCYYRNRYPTRDAYVGFRLTGFLDSLPRG